MIRTVLVFYPYLIILDMSKAEMSEILEVLVLVLVLENKKINT